MKEMRRNLNIKRLEVDPQKFFRIWLEVLKPFHKMTNKEMEVVSYMLYRRHILMEKIKDEKLVNEILFNRDMREDIKERLGYTTNQVMSNLFSDLRKKGVLTYNSINRNLIPNYAAGGERFQLIFDFVIDNEA